MAEFNNIVELFLHQTSEFGDRIALKYKSGGRWLGITWKQWESIVKDLAKGLIKLGLQSRDTVSIISANRPEWVHFDMATQMAGGILVPIYPTLTAEEAAFINRDAKVRIAIVENESQLDKLLSELDGLPQIEKAILLQGESEDPRVVKYDEFLKSAADLDDSVLEERYRDIKSYNIATYIYTSGTTGRPKGAMLTHENIMFVSEAVCKQFEFTPADRAISYLPLSHVYERVGGFYTALRTGVEISFAESIDKMVDNLAEVRPTILCGVPRVLEKAYSGIQQKIGSSGGLARKLFMWALDIGRQTAPYRMENKPLPSGLAFKHRLAKFLVYDKIAERFGGCLRFIAVAGAPMSKEIAEFFFCLNLLVIEGYGMTESSAPATLNTPQDFRFGTVGKPLPGVGLQIADDGEIILSGRSVFAGYFGMPEATQETLENGLLHTGDIGEIDENGMLRITDRKKDLIITAGGKNIAPQKIENMLIADPYVGQAVVVGDKYKYLTALISPDIDTVRMYAEDEGFEIGDREAVASNERVIELIKNSVAKVNQQLPRFETIKDFKLLKADLSQENGELTPTLKVKRKVVMEKHRGLVEQMYDKDAENMPKEAGP